MTQEKHLKSFQAIILSLFVPALAFCGTEIQPRIARVAERELPDYNLRFGELRLDLGYEGSVEYDTNTNSMNKSSDRDEGALLENGIDVGIFWPLSPAFTLDTTVYIGYGSRLSGDGTGGLILETRDEETVALDLRLGDNAILSLLDTASVNTLTVAESAEDSTGNLSILRNDTALQYEVILSDYMSLAVRAGREIERTLDSDTYENRDADTDYISATGGWVVNSACVVGPYASFRRLKHRTRGNNDADDREVGLQGTYMLTETTQLKLSLGYQGIDFDTDNDPTVTDDASGWVGSFGVISSPSAWIRQSLTLSRGQRYSSSVGNNYNKDTMLAYRLQWDLNERWSTDLGITYFHTSETGPGRDITNTVSPSIRIDRRLGERSSLYARCRYYLTDSRTDEQSEFTRVRTEVGVNVDF